MSDDKDSDELSFDEEDLQYWKDIKETTKPLATHHKQPPIHQSTSHAKPASGLGNVRPNPKEIPYVTGADAELVLGKTAGVDNTLATRVKQGKQPIEARLDLHGKTQELADRMLEDFIIQSYAQRKRMLLVITGKGGQVYGKGVLRTQVPYWLNKPELRRYILMFCYAQPKDGGEGALYVLLKRQR